MTRRSYLVKQYHNMKRRVTGKDPKSAYYAGKPICTREEYLDWALGRHDFERLWTAYEASGYKTKLCPSIDRLYTNGGYELDNMRFVARYENTRWKKNSFTFLLTNQERHARLWI